MSDYDVVIVGGGPAGASAAIYLAQSGARVLLVEQEKFPRAKLCGEFITPECLAHFARLGALDSLSGAGGAMVRETIFYTRGGRRVTVPSAWLGTAQGGALGLSRAEMDMRLLTRAREAGVEVLEGASVAGLLMQGEVVRGVRLSAAGGEARASAARVTIDATGRGRALARRVERVTQQGSARGRATLVAFKTHLEGARGGAEACEIYFYPGGYGGLSPVEGGLSNLCFIVRAEDARARSSDPARLMKDVVMRNPRAAETLGAALPRERWLGVALESFGRHEPVPVEGLIAIGDAASFIDPFTGSGMLMALESGELAAQVISPWLAAARRHDGQGFAVLARAYEARYAERFDRRLRLCGLLRRAAFAPRALTEVVALMLNSSARVRHELARATRRGETPDAFATRRDELTRP